jgi:hypothetical protein
VATSQEIIVGPSIFPKASRSPPPDGGLYAIAARVTGTGTVLSRGVGAAPSGRLDLVNPHDRRRSRREDRRGNTRGDEGYSDGAGGSAWGDVAVRSAGGVAPGEWALDS